MRLIKAVGSVAVLCTLVFAYSALVAGQTLGELARQEAERRQSAPKGKVITNDNLKPVPPSSAPPPASVPGTTLPPPPTLEKALAADPKATDAKPGAAPAAPAPAEEKKDEKYWRQRVATARDGLSRAQTFQIALEARIGALSTDFVNRDDPSQRAQVAQDRVKAMAELDRVKKEIVQYQKDLATISDEARRAGVPAGWLR